MGYCAAACIEAGQPDVVIVVVVVVEVVVVMELLLHNQRLLLHITFMITFFYGGERP